jgi:hypothetical protein
LRRNACADRQSDRRYYRRQNTHETPPKDSGYHSLRSLIAKAEVETGVTL